MFARWSPVHRAVEAPGTARLAAEGPPAAVAAGGPAESNFPQAVVACHGVLAAATYVLVLLTALNISGS